VDGGLLLTIIVLLLVGLGTNEKLEDPLGQWLQIWLPWYI